jgi:hypothetical protein
VQRFLVACGLCRQGLPLLLAIVALLGCGDDKVSGGGSPPEDVPPCGANDVTLMDGTCVTVGVPSDACAPGFEPDEGGGCSAVLPSEVCPPGLMAVPGDSVCREVAPCGEDPWGDIPIEPATVFVDVNYPNPDSDGSQAKPWTSIQEAVAAAASGSMIAIAAGSYNGEVGFSDKVLRVWGRCPGLVEIVAQAGDSAAFIALGNTDGTELHTLALRGAAVGVAFAGSSNMRIDRVWIHDTSGHGMDVARTFIPASATITGSLIEATAITGLFVSGSTAVVEASNIRGTAIDSGARGITVQDDSDPGNLTLSGSLIELSHEGGVVVGSSTATIHGSIIRTTAPGVGSIGGRGVTGQAFTGGVARPALTITKSAIEQSHEGGVIIAGGDMWLEHTTVRDTQVNPSSVGGGGIIVQIDSATMQRASANVLASVLERNFGGAVQVSASDATIDGVIVRDVFPIASNDGWAVSFQTAPSMSDRSTGTLRFTRIERAAAAGVVILGSDTLIHDINIYDTLGVGGVYGRGMAVALDLLSLERGNATISGVIIERSVGAGLAVTGADAIIEGSAIRGTVPNLHGAYGDGIVVVSYQGPAIASITNCHIADNIRGGIVNFGAATSVGNTVLECNPIPLGGELYEGQASTFEDTGGNICSCGDTEDACQISSSSLEPPSPLL